VKERRLEVGRTGLLSYGVRGVVRDQATFADQQ
jgi:hypothetical protein